MLQLNIKKAERKARKARFAVIGVSGSGKTYTALRVARGLAGDDGKILLLDTERSSATLYADVTDFDHADLDNFRYETFMAGIQQAANHNYDCLVIDSISHAWQEFLDQHGKMSGNSYTNWSKITPKYNALIQAVVNFPGHIIVTMRAKSEVVIEERNGKQVPKKVGMTAVMRSGSEYEFDVVGTMDLEHNLEIEKTRIDFLDGRIVTKPGEAFGEEINTWLSSGAAAEVETNSKASEGEAAVPHLFDFEALDDKQYEFVLANAQRFGGEKVGGHIWQFPQLFADVDPKLAKIDQYVTQNGAAENV